jgi:hypothetical protein
MTRTGKEQPRGREEEAMWQVHAAFRFGRYTTPEFDVTPALGLTLAATVIALIIHTSL